MENKIHTFTDIKLIFCWMTKRCEPFLANPEIAERVKILLAQDCRSDGISILELKIGKDYVFVSLLTPARHSASQIMTKLKGRSSRQLSIEFPDVMKEFDVYNNTWERGYFCRSFGDLDKQPVRDYILGKRQE